MRIFGGEGAGGYGSLGAWGSSGSGRGDGRRADACYEIFLAIRAADDPDVPAMPPRVFLGWLQTGYRVIGPPERSWELPVTQVIGTAQS